eukprot:NODE_4519_length_666_cov_223.646481.p1 GENE.NODE_4519_length_666_cov_223.646481~~NODE_4519_length_666_cov_223.646481.p1  ORF type:complete len:175 (+),score=52.32 NODE_4519_length_666_cov_223.646481:3-527(+)
MGVASASVEGAAVLWPDDGAFTVEVWVSARDEALQAESHRNPVASYHGMATGWELRLLRGGGASFMVTIDGVHHEVEGAAESSWAGGWTHVAGVLDGTALRVLVGGVVVGERMVPAGSRSSYDGPLCLAGNTTWRDRNTACLLAAVRFVRRGAAGAGDLLPAPAAMGNNFSCSG